MTDDKYSGHTAEEVIELMGMLAAQHDVHSADETLAIARRGYALLKDLQSRLSSVLSQLPEEMQDCTIRFKKCEVGHGRLTADNWIDNGCHQCRLGAVTNERDEARRSARYQRYRYRCTRKRNKDMHDRLRSLGALYEEAKDTAEGYETMIGWLFREFVPDESKARILELAPVIADAVSACNHEPGEDCPKHPMTAENQRPVSAEDEAAIDKATGVERQEPESTG